MMSALGSWPWAVPVFVVMNHNDFRVIRSIWCERMDLEFAKFSTECNVCSDFDILVSEEEDLPIKKGLSDFCNLLIRNVASHSNASDLGTYGGRHGADFERVDRVKQIDGTGHWYSLNAWPTAADFARMPEICPLRIEPEA